MNNLDFIPISGLDEHNRRVEQNQKNMIEERRHQESLSVQSNANTISKESNRIAAEANNIAREANKKSHRANIIAIVSIAIAFGSLITAIIAVAL